MRAHRNKPCAHPVRPSTTTRPPKRPARRFPAAADPKPTPSRTCRKTWLSARSQLRIPLWLTRNRRFSRDYPFESAWALFKAPGQNYGEKHQISQQGSPGMISSKPASETLPSAPSRLRVSSSRPIYVGEESRRLRMPGREVWGASHCLGEVRPSEIRVSLGRIPQVFQFSRIRHRLQSRKTSKTRSCHIQSTTTSRLREAAGHLKWLPPILTSWVGRRNPHIRIRSIEMGVVVKRL